MENKFCNLGRRKQLKKGTLHERNYEPVTYVTQKVWETSKLLQNQGRKPLTNFSQKLKISKAESFSILWYICLK